MNRPSIEELLEEKLEDLPSNVRNLFSSEEIGDALHSVSEKNGLKEEQVDLLADEIGYVLFRVTSLTSFKKTIQDNLGLVPSKALAISTELYGSIFQPVKKFLKDVDESELNPVPMNVIPKSKESQTSKTAADAQATSTPSINETTIDLDSDNESLNHHDILSEIENPSLSIPKIHDRETYTLSTNTLPEESLVEITGHVQENKDETIAPQTSFSTSNQVPTLTDEELLRKMSQNSVHHDIVPNLSGFKPLNLQNNGTDTNQNQISGNENTGVHFDIPTTNPLAKASNVAEKLSQKLDGATSSKPEEVYVSQKPQAQRIDPYREAI